MGQQRPHQLTDSFVRGLSTAFGDAGFPSTLEHIVERPEGSEDPIPGFVRLTFDNDGAVVGPNRIKTLDVHEVYWADRVTGLAKVWAVIQWLAFTSLIPIRAWAQQATIVAPSRSGTLRRFFAIVTETLRAILLPLIPIGLAAIVISGATSQDRLRAASEDFDDLKSLIPDPWVGVALAGLTLGALGMVWGALKLRSLARLHKHHRALIEWSFWSVFTAVVVIGAAIVLADAVGTNYEYIVREVAATVLPARRAHPPLRGRRGLDDQQIRDRFCGRRDDLHAGTQRALASGRAAGQDPRPGHRRPQPYHRDRRR